MNRLVKSRLISTNCLVKLDNCIVKHSLTDNKPIFKNPLNFNVGTPNSSMVSYYAVIGHRKTDFLNVIAAKFISTPALSRVYPILSELQKHDIIQYLNFNELSGLDKVYLSARYESYSFKGKLEMSDDVNSVENYITGDNNYNNNNHPLSKDQVSQVIQLFNLNHLRKKWINSLSNGQMRRARIAKSILTNPKLLIIDDPFLGLDPKQTNLVSESLYSVAKLFDMSIVLGLRFQDSVPHWVTHVAEVDDSGIKLDGPKEEIELLIHTDETVPSDRRTELSEIPFDSIPGDHLEFNNASVVYKNLAILSNFNWRVPKGSNWRILGENGTGKTTILSLITADHPQSWRSVLKVNGVLRKTGNGVTFFDINNKVGISSPELHALVPPSKTMNQIINNGLVKDIGNSNFLFSGDKLSKSPRIQQVFNAQFIKDILDTYGDTNFSQLSITLQKFTLFMRAIVKDPEIIVLDEAFSCMDDLQLMHNCHKLLDDEFKDATILAIGHIEWELPKYDYVIHLTGDEKRSYKVFKAKNT